MRNCKKQTDKKANRQAHFQHGHNVGIVIVLLRFIYFLAYISFSRRQYDIETNSMLLYNWGCSAFWQRDWSRRDKIDTFPRNTEINLR